jgi:hypothetical protein
VILHIFPCAPVEIPLKTHVFDIELVKNSLTQISNPFEALAASALFKSFDLT